MSAQVGRKARASPGDPGLLRKGLIGLFLLAVIITLVAFRLPAEYSVERSLLVDRPASVIYLLASDLNRFPEWSPVTTRDSGAKYMLSGITTGRGAQISWQGDVRRVGQGSLQIVRSVPNQRLEMALEVSEQGAAAAWLGFEQEGGGTRISLGLKVDSRQAENRFSGLLSRYFGLLIDPWLGPDFEQSLDLLGELARSVPAGDLTGAEIDVVEVMPQQIIFISMRAWQETDDLTTPMSSAFAEMALFLKQHDLSPAAAPMAITRARGQGVLLDAAVPVSGDLPPLSGRLEAGLSPAGRAVRLVHRGPYSRISESYRVLETYLSVRRLAMSGLSWEAYQSDPERTAPGESVISIYVQIEE